MATKNSERIDPINVACVIHSDGYDWRYVERLYNSVRRSSSRNIRFHVYTEHEREVPDHMIKHGLPDWPGVSGPKKSWWYKLNLFNPEHHAGPLLYFDLDCVIVRDIDWIVDLPSAKFWSIRDFRYLQSDYFNSINSSVMWFNTTEFSSVWNDFKQKEILQLIRQYPGDQDYIEAHIPYKDRRFLPDKCFQSYRWQVADGGWNFEKRQPINPGTGCNISNDCSVVVFHGHPKPHEVTDPKIVTLWC